MLKSHLGNGRGTVRRQVRTYDKAGIVATPIAAARAESNPEAFMRVPNITPIYVTALLFYGMASVTGCAVQGGPELGLAQNRTSNVLGEAEIASSRATTAYQALERVRPMYLVSKVDLAPTEERMVYLNGVRLGGVNELRLIAASEVKEIRFVRAIDATAYGVGRSGGAILVISKAGR
ncbi:MAG TPA: hypothetical protein VGN73_06760 [Gemmatimonadaceae bacterium]|nr:hypothetical protein [Gemmatimonadaceae bacterium]